MTPNGCILQSVLLSKILQRAQGTNPIPGSACVQMPAQKKKYRNPPIEFPAPKPITATPITPQFLDIKQAALNDPARTVEASRYLGVSKKTLLKYCSQHLITFMRYPDGSFRFRKAALHLFTAKCTIDAERKVA